MSEFKNLVSLALCDAELVYFPILPPSVTHLVLNHNPCSFRGVIGPAEEWLEAPPLVSLQHFHCESTYLTIEAIAEIIMPAVEHKLFKDLRIGHRHVYDTELDILPPSASLASLSLANLGLGEELLIRTVAKYPNLESLDVSLSKITGVAVKKFVLQGIKQLNADECQDLSVDAVIYARSMGVTVKYSFPSRRPLALMAS